MRCINGGAAGDTYGERVSDPVPGERSFELELFVILRANLRNGEIERANVFAELFVLDFDVRELPGEVPRYPSLD